MLIYNTLFMIIYPLYNKVIFTFFRYLIFILFVVSSIKNNAQSSTVTAGLDIITSFGSVCASIGNVVYKSNDKFYHISDGVEHAFIINQIAGISTIKVSIFPNPTTDLVYFKVENLNYKNLNYKVFDIFGNLLKEGNLINIQSYISIGSLPQNNFVVKLYRGNTESQSFKILKIH